MSGKKQTLSGARIARWLEGFRAGFVARLADPTSTRAKLRDRCRGVHLLSMIHRGLRAFLPRARRGAVYPIPIISAARYAPRPIATCRPGSRGSGTRDAATRARLGFDAELADRFRTWRARIAARSDPRSAASARRTTPFRRRHIRSRLGGSRPRGFCQPAFIHPPVAPPCTGLTSHPPPRP